MLRLATSDGWWLVTHPDHAHLAGEFAAAWGNELFASPEPRAHVLRGIYAHDDGWRARDAVPTVTREGKPAAFSTELVGKYSAFEEIDLEDYLAVRRNAVLAMAEEDPYAGILISMHTHNLLSERADRSTIRPEQLPLLDSFLASQQSLQCELRRQLLDIASVSPNQLDSDQLDNELTENFRLLQATDNLSLLSCVDFAGPATLLHPLRTQQDTAKEIEVKRIGERSYRLSPYPLREPVMRFALRARFVPGVRFASSAELADRLVEAPVQTLEVTISE
ncbi:MAG TPA: DUF3891 family protein [Silvibacterium sp.]|nr:DUF3891 family protein [Silvibacterium sp.]